MIAHSFNRIRLRMRARKAFYIQPLLGRNTHMGQPALLVKTQNQTIRPLPEPACTLHLCRWVQASLPPIRHEQGMALLPQLQVVIQGPASVPKCRCRIAPLPIPVTLQLQQGPGLA
ncbi:hypothetical protein EGT81_12035 [Alcaligenes faecalis]|uniref:Uncharacterized protein n=1 Tax=Alcaligenes faecalis TaxID=511 RepID=A0A2U2BFK3_ALCFA|nr:hypothetical protein DF183_18685 [Alcaligenes faecalis]RSE61475.1 hypothetical protein EGT81_12035 [Alcaligenes faecalis]